MGLGRAALCKGRKTHPRAAGREFWERGEWGDEHHPAAWVFSWISGGCAWAELHTWASAFILGVKSPIWCFPEQGRNNNPWYVT